MDLPSLLRPGQPRRTLLALLVLGLIGLFTPHAALRAQPPAQRPPLTAVGEPPPAEPRALPISAASASAGTFRVLLPLVGRPSSAEQIPTDEWLALVNAYRKQAGVPPVRAEERLSANCWEHARYMAENNHLTHYQDEGLPWASSAGAACGARGNAWLGGDFPRPIWRVSDTIEGWMASPGHRIWLLYPTTPSFGYGFYAAANNRAGAALDVLSEARFAADKAYTAWPIRYPAPGQVNVPPGRYAITLFWPYFGPAPTITSTILATSTGELLAHSATTELPVGHKGVMIVPGQDLPAGATLTVTVAGLYQGAEFSTTWTFATRATSSEPGR